MKTQSRLKTIILSSLFVLCAVFVVSPTATSAFSLFPSEPSALGQNDDFRTYIVAFYNFALPATAVVAVVLIMIGGIIWITSAGDQGRIAKAKEFIINPIIGLIILAGTYVILGFINPNLVVLQPVAPDPLGTPGACIISETECKFVISRDDCTNGEFVEGTTCTEARELKAFESAMNLSEEEAKKKFACEKDDVGHNLSCSLLSNIPTGLVLSPGELLEIYYCARHCRQINSSCRPSAAFGNDISCNTDTNTFKCFCKYDPE